MKSLITVQTTALCGHFSITVTWWHNYFVALQHVTATLWINTLDWRHITYTGEQIWHGPVSKGTDREWLAPRRRHVSENTQLSSCLNSSAPQQHRSVFFFSLKVRSELKENPADNTSVVKYKRSTFSLTTSSAAIGSQQVKYVSDKEVRVISNKWTLTNFTCQKTTQSLATLMIPLQSTTETTPADSVQQGILGSDVQIK